MSRRSAAMLGAVGIIVASVCSFVLGPGSASGREQRPRSVDLAAALAIDRNGKIVVAGLSNGPDQVFALARYTAGGRLDHSFGTRGMVLTGFGANSYGGASSVAIGAEGKIAVAGWLGGIRSGLAIVRYTRAGRLDRRFGRNGKVRTSGGGASGFAIQRDGKLVAAGGNALVRYTRRGTLDRSFGRGGRVRTRVGVFSTGLAVAIQPDGKIVVAGGGQTSIRAKMGFALARYEPDGRLDLQFGNHGRVVTKVSEFDTQAVGLVLQTDGKLVVAGNAFVDGDAGFALVRYTPDGRLDPSFGADGQVFNPAGSVTSLAIQRDRKLVTAGTGMRRHPGFSLARFLPDGSPDESFGRDGKLLTQFQSPARPYALVVRADGSILAAGSYWGRDFILARFRSTGRLDRSFGAGGKVVTDFGPAWASAQVGVRVVSRPMRSGG